MISIPLRPIPIRILLLLTVIAGFGMLSRHIVRTAIGDSVMIFVERSPGLPIESRIEGADLALRYSPHDPLIHWQRGGVYLNAFNEEQEESRLLTAIEELQRAVKLSPRDYRIWLLLGRVLERSGSREENEAARKAIERAIELAPNHFDPHWALGNHLLRAGDRDGSFAQMRLALANRPSALPLVFDYCWNAFLGDGQAIAAALDPPIELRPKLIALLINRGGIEDALAMWKSINAPAASEIQKISEALVNAGRYSQAYEIWSNADLPEQPSPDAGSCLSNGGFERNNLSPAPFYSWRMSAGGSARILLDRKNPAEGMQSLRTGFDLRENIALTIAQQIVPVKPTTAYRLSFQVKIEELESLSPPLVEIYDPALELGATGRVRAATSPLPNGNHDWKEYQLDLATTIVTEALKVRIQRPPCSEPPCPITGRIWFDDFKLVEKIISRNPNSVNVH